MGRSGGRSVSGGIRTAADVPDPPYGIQIVNQSDHTVSFSWEAPDDNGQPILWYEYRSCASSQVMRANTVGRSPVTASAALATA